MYSSLFEDYEEGPCYLTLRIACLEPLSSTCDLGAVRQPLSVPPHHFAEMLQVRHPPVKSPPDPCTGLLHATQDAHHLFNPAQALLELNAVAQQLHLYDLSQGKTSRTRKHKCIL